MKRSTAIEKTTTLTLEILGTQKMNKLIILSLLFLVSCSDPELVRIFELTKQGRTCFNINTPPEYVGHYCIERIKSE
jgi:hypothetical protein